MPSRFRRLMLALLLFGPVVCAQTLAHPGWRGNGIASELWWKHAAFVRFPENTTFVKASESMDAMSQAGADSLILPDLLSPAAPSLAAAPPPDASGGTQPFAGRFGTADDLDALLREAAARRMHVLLHVDLLRLAGNPGELRYWMSRGIAGFDAGDVTPAQTGTLRLLRGAMDRFPGRRILLAHMPQRVAGARDAQDPVTLHVLLSGESMPANGTVQTAVEGHTTDALKTALPPHTTLIVDAALLLSEETRETLRRTLAAQGRSPHAYSVRRSRRRRSR